MDAELSRPFVENMGAASAEMVGFPNFDDFGARSLRPPTESDQSTQRSFYNDDRLSTFFSSQGGWFIRESDSQAYPGRASQHKFLQGP